MKTKTCNILFRFVYLFVFGLTAQVVSAQSNFTESDYFKVLAAGQQLTIYDHDYSAGTATAISSNPSVCRIGTNDYYYKVYKMYDRVFISLDKDYKPRVDFDFTITFNISVYDHTGALIQQNNNQVVTLNYKVNDPHTHKTLVQYENAKCKNKLVVSIVSVSNASNIPLSHFIVGAQVEKASVQYMPDDPASTVLSSISKSINTTKNTLDINWGAAAWATSYDLQWVYIDDYDRHYTLASGHPDLARISNAIISSGTKVNLAGGTSYSIPLMYDKGYIAFRVRGNGQLRGATVNAESEIPGRWQQDFDGANITSNYYIVALTSGYEDQLNWQSSITFAEGGKKMLQAAYYDGVSRERQKISLLQQAGKHNLETGMVEETVYDQEGRAAARILPAPTLLPHVKFYPGFNRSDKTDSSFSASDFDFILPGNECDNNVYGLKTTSGASKYYSSSNGLLSTPALARMYSAIPDAAKYPYALTVYTDDNTGRVKEQSGVGTAFKPGSDHTTAYFYGKPLQTELDRLFGSDVGYSHNYQKTMVKDANGQFSISYKDLSGRVIATSLAGASPANVDALLTLPSSPGILRSDLLNKVDKNNAHGIDDVLYLAESKRQFSANLVVSSAAKRQFYYELRNNSFAPGCLDESRTMPATTSAVQHANFIVSDYFHHLGSPATIIDLKLCDLDDDGDQDIVYTTSGKIVFLQNRMTGNAVTAESFEVSSITVAQASPLIEIRDLDRDHLPDLLLYSFGATEFTIYKNLSWDRSVTFSLAKTQAMPASVTIGQMIANDDEDGTQKSVVWAICNNGSGHKAYTYEVMPDMSVSAGLFNFITPPSPITLAPGGGTTIRAYLADVFPANAGKEILLTSSDGKVYIYSTAFALLSTVSPASGGPSFSDAFGLAFGDLNGDGITDLVAYSATSGTIQYLAGGTFTSTMSFTTGPAFGANLASLVVADFNLDAKADLVATTASNLFYVQNNGTSTISFATATSTSPGNFRLYACDFNIDSKPDFISVKPGVSLSTDVFYHRNTINNTTSCYECVVDVTISMKSKDCGTENLADLKSAGGVDDTHIMVGPSLGSGLSQALLPNCSSEPQVFTRGRKTDGGSADIWYANKNNNVAVGEYELSRTLTVNQRALEIYANNYIRHNACLKTYQEFEDEAMSKMDFTHCDISCAERSLRLGTSYLTSKYQGTGCEKYGCLTEPEYLALKAVYEKDCGQDFTGCESYMEQMISDMSPEGQYAKTRNIPEVNPTQKLTDPSATDTVDPTRFALSVFNEGNSLPQKKNILDDLRTKYTAINVKLFRGAWTPSWRYPYYGGTFTGEKDISYLNEQGNIDYVMLTTDEAGELVPAVLPEYQAQVIFDTVLNAFKVKPNFLKNVTDFLQQWKPEWANALLRYHPEYGFYNECTLRDESNRWDQQMNQTNTAADADSVLFFTGWATQPANRAAVETLVNKDPYFNALGASNAEFTAFVNRILVFNTTTTGTPVNHNLWEVVYQIVNCAPGCSTCTLGSGSLSTDDEWRMFRSLYQSLKQEVLKRHDIRKSLVGGFYNGCISETPFNTNKDLFDRTFYDNPILAKSSLINKLINTPGYQNFYQAGRWSYYTFFRPAAEMQFANTQIYNPEQPCTGSRYELYQGKRARFYPDMPAQSTTDAQVCERLTANYSDFELPFCQDKITELMEKSQKAANAKISANCRQCEDAMSITALLNELVKNPQPTISFGTCVRDNFTQFEEPLRKMLNNNGATLAAGGSFSVGSFFNLTTHTWEVSIYYFVNTFKLSINLPGVTDLSEIESVCCLRGAAAFNDDLSSSYAFDLDVQMKLKPGDTGYAGFFTNIPGMGSAPNVKQVTISGTAEHAQSLIRCEKQVFYKLRPISTSIQSLLNGLTYTKPLVVLNTLPNNYDSTFTYALPWAPNASTSPRHLVLSTCDPTQYQPTYMAAFYNKSFAVDAISLGCVSVAPKSDNLTLTVIDNSPSSYTFIFHDLNTSTTGYDSLLHYYKSFKLNNMGVALASIRYFDNVRTEGGVVKIDAWYDNATSAYAKQVMTLESQKFVLAEPAGDLDDETAFGAKQVTEDVKYTEEPYSKCKVQDPPAAFIEVRSSADHCSALNVLANPPTNVMEHVLFLIKSKLPDYGVVRQFDEGTYRYLFTKASDGAACPTDCDINVISEVDLSTLKPGQLQGIGRVYNSKNTLLIYVGDTEPDSRPLITVSLSCPLIPRCPETGPPGNPAACYPLCPAMVVEGTDFGRNYNEITIENTEDCTLLESGVYSCDLLNNADAFHDMYDATKRKFSTSLTPDYTLRKYKGFTRSNLGATLLTDWPVNSGRYAILEDLGARDCHAKPHSMYMSVPADATDRMVWGKDDIEVEKGQDYFFRFELYRLNNTLPPGNLEVKVTVNGVSLTCFTYQDLYEFVWSSKEAVQADVKIYVKNNSAPEFLVLNNVLIYKSCKPSLCCPRPFPEVQLYSNCRTMLVNIATDNAHRAYDSYIANLRNAFKQKYTAKCLDVWEEFTMRHEDDEHHFTLYYYDQAGNLVRTVPPKGVIPITAQADLDKIATERFTGKRTIYTGHKMATTYSYNSLNQLVKQSTPDQDDLAIFKATEQAGAFGSTFKMNDFSFAGNGNTGFAVGEDRTGSTIKGYIFKTENRGTNWSEQSAFGLNDVNDILSVTYNAAQVFYGAGNNGMLVNRDAMGVYTVSGLPVSTDLVKLAAYETGGKLTVYVIAKDGSLFTRTHNGSAVGNWQGPGNGLKLKLAGNVKDMYVHTDGSLYAVCDKGYVYRSKDLGATWFIANRKSTRIGYNLLGSAWTASGSLVLFGEHGTMVQAVSDAANPEAGWPKLNTGFVSDISGAAFANLQNGVFIIAAKLQVTADGGKTITPVSLSAPYSTMNITAVTNKLGKYYAVTESGYILWSANGTSWAAMDFVAQNQATYGNISALYVTEVLISGINRTCFATGTTKGYSYYKAVGVTGWMRLDASASVAINKVHYTYKSAKHHVLAQTASSVLYANSTSTTFAAPSGVSSAETFCAKPNDEAYITAAGSLYKATDFTANSWSAVTISGVPSAVKTLDLYNGTKLIALTSNGGMHIIDAGTPASVKDFSYHIETNVPLNGITLLDDGATKTVAIVGGSGMFLASDFNIEGTADPKWTIRKTGTAKNLNAVTTYAVGTPTLKAVGDQGVISSLSLSSGTSADASGYAAVNFTKVVSNSAQTFIATNTNRIIDLSLTAYNLLPVSAKVNALVYDGTDVLAAGTNGLIWKYYSGSGFGTQNPFQSKALKSIAMADHKTGVAVGKEGTVWRTTNGGASWSKVTLLTTGTADLNKVHFNNSTDGLIIGRSGTLDVVFRTTNAGSSWTEVTAMSLPNLGYNDITGMDDVFAIGANNGKVHISANRGLSWTVYTMPGTAKNITTVHMSTASSIFAAGETGYMYRIDLTDTMPVATLKQPNTAVASGLRAPAKLINDVYFTDDRTGYLVAEDNNTWKTVDGADTWEKLTVSGLSTLNPKKIDAASTERIVVLSDDNASRFYTIYDMKNEFSTRFYYDRLGRLVLSQNSKQYAANANRNTYSYTVYDFKGRITEVGEANHATLAAETNYRNGILDDALLVSWLAASTRKQVTKTYYDVLTLNGNLPLFFGQKNLRNRVTDMTYQEVYNSSALIYDYGVHYSYDIHGNVNELLTENRAFAIKTGVSSVYESLMFKHIAYEYDLLSGKVNRVNYQKDKPDQFFHRYEYDMQNKLTAAYTSTDAQNWEQDAAYEYYLHGPMARVELGEEHVQGLDYTYTLQGWLKAVNGSRLDNAAFDLGEDGKAGTYNHTFARDEAAFSLGYYTDDYLPVNIAQANWPVATTAASNIQPGTFNSDLFNGNIGHMVTAIRKLDGAAPLASAYRYDQLNRLASANYYNNFDAAGNAWQSGGTALKDHKNEFTYDANGNILYQLRNGSNALNKDMDELEYIYDTDRNRLKGVSDSRPANNYPDDVDDQGVTELGTYRNYEYDAIGNLVKDQAEEIETIDWNVYGKIRRITRKAGSPKPDLEFTYGADGNRATKKVIPKTGYPTMTLYSRDAQGNVMGTYMKKYQSDIYIAGLSYQVINNQLLALMGQTSFEGFIPYMHANMGSPYIASAMSYWWAYHAGAIDPATIDPASALCVNGNMNWLGGIKSSEVTGVFIENEDAMEEFFTHLCDCIGNKSELAKLFLTTESSYNAFMTVMENLYPDEYNNYFSTITWNDYSKNGSDSYVWYQIDNYFDCSMMLNMIKGLRAAEPAAYAYFWNTGFDSLVAMLAGLNSEGGCTEASYSLAHWIWTYNSAEVTDYLQEQMGDEGTYFTFLATYDPIGMLLAMFHYDISQTPNATDNLSGILNDVLGTGNITAYMNVISQYLTPAQYAQLLQNLQPYSPAILEQTYVNERFMYGSSRLGNYNRQQLLSSVKFIGTYLASGSFTGVAVVETPVVAGIPAAVNGLVSQQVYHGNKGYELSNHLGNVLAVVSDRKTQNATVESATNYNTTNDVGGWTGFNSGVVSWSSGKTIITGSNTKGGQLTLSGLTVGNMYQVYLDVTSVTGANIELENSGIKTMLYAGKFYTIFKATATSSTMQVKQNTAGTFTLQLDSFCLQKINYYNAEVLQANDYSPFGAPMVGRSYDRIKELSRVIVTESKFETTADGWVSLNTASIAQDAGRLKVMATSGGGAARKTMNLVVGRSYKVRFRMDIGTCTTGVVIPMYNSTITSYAFTPDLPIIVTESGIYEGHFIASWSTVNWLFEAINGNPFPAQFWVDDFVVEEYVEPQGRAYAFGFNGKEMDNETYGDGNEYDYGFRVYNPRLGKFLSVDPLSKSYPSLTPYQFASNMPVWAIDLDGMEAWVATQKWSPAIVQKYRLYVQAEVQTIIKKADAGQINNNTVFDCADLAVHLLIGFASENSLPVSFTLADGQVITNSTPSVLVALNNGTTKNIELNSTNFEGIVRDFSYSTSLQNDMTDMPQGYKPQAGDLSNAGGHVNVVRSPEMLVPTDVGNSPGYTQTVSGTTGSTANPNGGTLTGVPLTNDRLHVFGPEEPMTWSMWNVMIPPPTPPPGAGTGMQPLPQDNARVAPPPPPVITTP